MILCSAFINYKGHYVIIPCVADVRCPRTKTRADISRESQVNE